MDHNGSDERFTCVKIEDVETTAKLAYYVARFYKTFVPSVP
jgi:hypothetical protein